MRDREREGEFACVSVHARERKREGRSEWEKALSKVSHCEKDGWIYYQNIYGLTRWVVKMKYTFLFTFFSTLCSLNSTLFKYNA